MARGGAASKALDEDHAAAAARTWRRRGLLVVAAWGIVVGLRRACRKAEQFTGACDVGAARAAGEQAIVTDAVEAVGQHVAEEAADELGRRERHGLEALGPFDAIVLPLEGDAVVVAGDQPAVGDGDAMGVAGEISEHGLRSAERLLGIDHPFAWCSGARYAVKACA